MSTPVYVYNSLSRQKELFEPLKPPFVGLYLCGPTVYGEPHLGHARPAITFDVVVRYLRHLGYKVRYVRNITDVGHLVNDADAGEDKIAKKARLEQLEPMEVVQQYTIAYREAMHQLNTLVPSIEPTASGHIIEQINMTQSILDAGLAYVVDGSVYFDVMKYNEQHHYGKLSGRVLEDLQASERELEGQDAKRNKADFALWKKAEPEHIMRWPSPWGDGFPGWHIECSAMSSKYLGETFDIHGGGMDLLFPHHECEIAQSVASCGKEPVRYWMHNNMVTINGQKMGKSLGNAINLSQFFTGEHPLLEHAYSPMTIRFFILQSHYRSTLDFTNEALLASEKGLKRLMAANKTLKELIYPTTGTVNNDLDAEITGLCSDLDTYMNDDFNTAQTLAALFELSAKINGIKDGHIAASSISAATFERLKTQFVLFTEEILGLKDEDALGDNGVTDGLMQLIIDIRKQSREKKDYATSDQIRDALAEVKIQLKDGKEGTAWTYLN
ncbi:cysteine--tRNA ligase [soil metagenome]